MNASVAPRKPGMQPSTANIQVMQLTTAYWTSRCLHVVAELGVADHLGNQPTIYRISLRKPLEPARGRFTACSAYWPQSGYSIGRMGTWHHTEASRFLRYDEPGS